MTDIPIQPVENPILAQGRKLRGKAALSLDDYRV
jgi:hypothetical protein